MRNALKQRKDKPTKNFGKDADVEVISKDSVYFGKKGHVVNGVLNLDGTYIVHFGRPTGDQFIHANDLDLVEDLAAPEDVQIKHSPDQPIPLAIIHADSRQPRRTYNQEALAELAEDVKADGVLQAILVRPHSSLPDGHYMIVFGERRWRAATMAGLQEIPAKVREMSDERALELQLVENSHREDVHPLEEGYAFRRMREYHNTEEIAHLIRRGKTYVRERMSLTNLTREFQDIFLAGHISFANALLLCKAAANVQEQILKESSKYLKPGQDGWKLGNLVQQIREGERNLDLATFETEDVLLYPEMGACGACKHNSAVNELFGDINGRICNNAGCFAIKTERAFEANVKHNIADGVVLVSLFDYSDLGRKRVAAVKDMGLPVLMDGAVKIVERTAEPTLVGYIAKNPGVNELLLEQRFGGEYQAWQKHEEDIAAAEADGRLKKAFVVAGVKAGTFQEVIVAKPVTLESSKPKVESQKSDDRKSGMTGGSVRDLGIDETLIAEQSAKSIRKAAVKRYHKLLASDEGGFLGQGSLVTAAEESGLVLYLWGRVFENDEDLIEPLQRHLRLEPAEGEYEIIDADNIRLFNAVIYMTVQERRDLIGNLARLLMLDQFEPANDYEFDGEGAALRAIALVSAPEAAGDIEAETFLKTQAS